MHRPGKKSFPCRTSLSIYVEDVDSKKGSCQSDKMTGNVLEENHNERTNIQYSNNQQNEVNEQWGKCYTREAIQEAIEQILEEMQRRKHEFCKLIDEHDAVIEHLKRIESEGTVCNIAQHSPIMT